MIRLKFLPQISQIHTENEKSVKIRAIRGKNLRSFLGHPAKSQRPKLLWVFVAGASHGHRAEGSAVLFTIDASEVITVLSLEIQLENGFVGISPQKLPVFKHPVGKI